jgi:hypothetical protein
MTRWVARAYEQTEGKEQLAGQWYEEAITIALRNLKQRSSVNQLVDLFETGSKALCYQLRVRKNRQEALAVATRVTDAIDPNMNVRIKLPRPAEARRLQGRWWLASRARYNGLADAEPLGTEAVTASLAKLDEMGDKGDPYTLAVCAFTLDDFGGPANRDRATRIWRTVHQSLPEHSWIEKRLSLDNR